MAYNKEFASVYDVFTENVSYHKRAGYINSIFRKNGIKDGILLDLCCGTGSFTKEFAKKGYDVIAVDISPDMLMQAKENCADIDREILFLCQDAQDLDLYGTIDCCICCLDSLNHLEDFTAFSRAIEKVSLFMRPGGIFIFDVNTVHKHNKTLSGKTFVYDCDDSFLVWQNSECAENSINLFIDIFHDDGTGHYTRTSEQFTETAYSISTIKKVLKASGFKCLNCYKDMTKRHAMPSDDRVYFVAEKL